MRAVLHISLWVSIGILFGSIHLFLLYRTVEQVRDADVVRARRRILRGLPLRLGLWAPALGLAARSGALACLGLVAGSMLSRCVAWLQSGPRPLVLSKGRS